MAALRLQAIYFMFMGLWPLLHIRSFQAVTGPKTDTWLVRTIAWFFIMVAAQLWVADNPSDVVVTGLGSALIIGIADAYYSLRGRISKVYLLDVIPQLVFVLGWMLFLIS